MNLTYRALSLIILPPVMVVLAGLSWMHATTTPTGAAGVAHLGGSATIIVTPGRADAENTFIVGGVQARTVRILSRSLDMNMGVTTYPAGSLGDGRWQIVNAEVPMVGRWGIEVQARRDNAWVTVGTVAYNVPFEGTMQIRKY